MRNKLLKYLFLFWFGGSFYVTLEVFWRSRSHVSMFLLAGILFVAIGLLNEIWGWETPLSEQIFIGWILALAGELITGYIVNIKMGLHIWDYSNLRFQFLGQLSLAYALLWIPVILLAILLDDIIRWRFFSEEKPKYQLFKQKSNGKKAFVPKK